ncbi:hypothetical protein [Microbacterium sp. NPDC058389]|uniref:hypothetical protein n=1 Tax=Microbacterium sp. NPDC058389 TaxID=3346475 RepID=UPI00364D4506
MDCASTPIACQLDRIADAMTGFDWNGFATTLIATIIGALVAAGIGLAVARMERPQPFFTAEATPDDFHWLPEGGKATISLTVTNVGDGPAYNVRVRGVGGAGAAWEARTAKLDPGDSIRGAILVPASGDYDLDATTVQYIDTRVLEWPATAAALIEWQQPPQRHRVRSHRVRLADPTP